MNVDEFDIYIIKEIAEKCDTNTLANWMYTSKKYHKYFWWKSGYDFPKKLSIATMINFMYFEIGYAIPRCYW